MPKILVNGLNFHYLQTGQGPDLVMLHGLMGNLSVWHLKMVPMLRRRFRVTTYDLRGHGRTDIAPSGYSTGDMAEDLRALLDTFNIERVNLVGHSLGADICMHFALRYPERVERLVVIEAGIPALVEMRKSEGWEGWTYWAQLLEEYTGVPVPPDKLNDIGYMARRTLDVPIIYGPAKGLPRKQAQVLQLLETTTLIQDYEIVDDMTLANLGAIPHPKLVIYDSDSPYIGTYNALCGVLTNYQSLLLPPGKHRHFSPLEQPNLLVEHITAFLNEDKQLEPVAMGELRG